tara:strand:- start:178039 stop:178932 length:894 start_codon:yes stop_codon:yes gene_type:complete
MKINRHLLAGIIVLIVYFNVYSQTPLKKNEKLLGVITKNDLTTDDYSKWFSPQFNSYAIDKDSASKISEPLKEFEILVFMGTWCGDSKKEVPRFYKLLEEINYPIQKLKIIAVDSDKDQYKKSPNGEEKGLNIHKVPTFIFYKDGKEVNRIIEHPITSFEADIDQIINTNTYEPNYNSIDLVYKLLNEKGATYIKTSDTLLKELKLIIKTDAELNSYGYFYLNDKDFDKAIAIFTLNNKIFPTNYNTFDSLAEAYELSGKLDLALKNYELAYSLIEQNPIIVRLKEKIENLKNNNPK